VYFAGLAVPFIISPMAVEKFITAFKQIRRWLPWINRTSAALLIIVGIMLLTRILTTLTGTLSGLYSRNCVIKSLCQTLVMIVYKSLQQMVIL
jgi:cytochrome c-type biogenesis protein